MGLKVIYFDHDGTLWDPHAFLEPTLELCVKIGMEKGLKGELNEILMKLKDIRKEQGSNSDEHFDYLCQEIMGRPNRRIINPMIAQYHKSKDSNMQLFRNVHNVLNQCKEENYVLAMATNGIYDKQRDKLNQLGILHYFEITKKHPEIHVIDDLVAVGEGDLEKPNPYTWDVLREKIQNYYAKAPEIEIHVGDKYMADIYGANKQGIITIKSNEGAHKDETIENVINKEGRNDAAFKELIKPDYTIDNIRQLPALMEMIESGYHSLKEKKSHQIAQATGFKLYN